jgi:hypothetical protein
MLTSTVRGGLLEDLARQTAVCPAIWIRFWNRCAFIPGFAARPPHDGDAGRDNPDAWLPATLLKGHNEQV